MKNILKKLLNILPQTQIRTTNYASKKKGIENKCVFLFNLLFKYIIINILYNSKKLNIIHIFVNKKNNINKIILNIINNISFITNLKKKKKKYIYLEKLSKIILKILNKIKVKKTEQKIAILLLKYFYNKNILFSIYLFTKLILAKIKVFYLFILYNTYILYTVNIYILALYFLFFIILFHLIKTSIIIYQEYSKDYLFSEIFIFIFFNFILFILFFFANFK
jgi:hypothetical protein